MTEIRIQIDDGGLARALELSGTRAKREASKAVRGASLGVEKRVKQDMPVDTGRARASWGHWTPGDIDRSRQQEASQADSHFEISEGGLTVSQGSNLDYMESLNAGHSEQAEAGFIDMAALAGARALSELLGRTFRAIFR